MVLEEQLWECNFGMREVGMREVGMRDFGMRDFGDTLAHEPQTL